jgi:hypothetical protein
VPQRKAAGAILERVVATLASDSYEREAQGAYCNDIQRQSLPSGTITMRGSDACAKANGKQNTMNAALNTMSGASMSSSRICGQRFAHAKGSDPISACARRFLTSMSRFAGMERSREG